MFAREVFRNNGYVQGTGEIALNCIKIMLLYRNGISAGKKGWSYIYNDTQVVLWNVYFNIKWKIKFIQNVAKKYLLFGEKSYFQTEICIR